MNACLCDLGSVKIVRGFSSHEDFCEESEEISFFKIFDRFKQDFLCGGMTLSEDVLESQVHFGSLIETTEDEVIIGESFPQTSLYELFALLKQQPSGNSGPLLNNGLVNLFYMKNFSGHQRAVIVYWFEGGWMIDSFIIGFEKRRKGTRVFWSNPRNQTQLIMGSLYATS